MLTDTHLVNLIRQNKPVQAYNWMKTLEEYLVHECEVKYVGK